MNFPSFEKMALGPKRMKNCAFCWNFCTIIYLLVEFAVDLAKFFINTQYVLCACLWSQVYPCQPASGSYAMSGTAVQGYPVPMEQIPAGTPIPGQPAPR